MYTFLFHIIVINDGLQKRLCINPGKEFIAVIDIVAGVVLEIISCKLSCLWRNLSPEPAESSLHAVVPSVGLVAGPKIIAIWECAWFSCFLPDNVQN